MWTRLAAAAALCALGGAALAEEAAAPSLLFSYFVGNGEDGLHLAHSSDGLRWEALAGGRPVLAPAVGEREQLMRDPCIVRGPDGRFHLVWTPGWREQGIGYAWSSDLITWSAQRFLPVMAEIPGVKNCWAPELFHDAAKGEWLVFWASTVPDRVEITPHPEGRWNHRMYYTVTADFERFTPPALLYDHGFSVIDSTIARTDDGYVMILKDETPAPPEKNLRVARAAKPAGPWQPPSPPITGDYWAEGPTIIHWRDRWHVYFDRYMEGRMGLVVSQDLEQWDDWSDRVQFPEGVRHGTVLMVDAAEITRLKEAFPPNP